MNGEWKRVVAFGACIAAAAACNLATGAADIELVEEDDDGVHAGVGGADPSPGAIAASTGSGMEPAGSTIASSSSGAPPCEYPPGPYGVGQGETVPSNLSWQGYLAGGNEQGTLSVTELHDCDGTRGIHAVLFDTSQYG